MTGVSSPSAAPVCASPRLPKLLPLGSQHTPRLGPRRVRVRRRQGVPLQALQGPHPLDAARRRRELLQEGVQDGARAAQKAALVRPSRATSSRPPSFSLRGLDHEHLARVESRFPSGEPSPIGGIAPRPRKLSRRGRLCMFVPSPHLLRSYRPGGVLECGDSNYSL